jgi:hypothetical protein
MGENEDRYIAKLLSYDKDTDGALLGAVGEGYEGGDLNFIVSNGPYEGTGVRIQLRVGTQQYEAVILRHDWTSGGPTFQLNLRITPNSSGRLSLVEANVQSLPVVLILPKPQPLPICRQRSHLWL